MRLAGGFLLAAAAGCAAASGGLAATCAGGAASSEAEADGQQECEHSAMRLQALQTRSSLAGAPSPGSPIKARPAGPADLDMRVETGYVEGNPYVFSPNVYLKEMVDPSNYWGWCLDIAGSPPMPSCTSIQGHSCKSTGEDTQFTYDSERHELRAVNFNSECQPLYSGQNDIQKWNATTENMKQGCVSVNGDIVAGATLGISKCEGRAQQQFIYTPKCSLPSGMTASASSSAPAGSPCRT
ncbi:unnamed protein product [Prorocentrum cordatum]|uniref:Ricin B lectin domain-containing protein n=1 Tax=Prorocentrum cordatum TaxID=2364126 RepID=A0ABN9STK6_9DINO|nr:unnamed protein product [Polarella glacialis]